jgi:hypothetical protein
MAAELRGGAFQDQAVPFGILNGYVSEKGEVDGRRRNRSVHGYGGAFHGGREVGGASRANLFEGNRGL